tara:strand:- start:7531 stop:8703 length:1173 start_codon:yes stop_codon:yes gene_type:complete
MSYYERLSKEYGDMGTNAGNVLSNAQSKASEMLTEDTDASDSVESKEMGKLGTMVGEKIGGKYLMGKAIDGLQHFVAGPRRALADQAAEQKFSEASAKGDQVGDIYAKGSDRLAQGTNADGSLVAEPGSVRGGLNQMTKFREGDTTPEDIVNDPDGAYSGIAKLSQKNADRFNALDDDAQQSVRADLSSNPQFKPLDQINAEQQSGAITADEAKTQGMNSKLMEQDAVGDGEMESTSTTLRGANPFTGETMAGEGGAKEVVGQMGDTQAETLDRATGLTSGETSGAEVLTKEASTLAEAGGEALASTGLETALSAVPIIGEIAGIGFGLYKGISTGIQSHKDQVKDQAAELVDNSNINTTMKYAGFNRPSFGSMALPSFDTSKSATLLQE